MIDVKRTFSTSAPAYFATVLGMFEIPLSADAVDTFALTMSEFLWPKLLPVCCFCFENLGAKAQMIRSFLFKKRGAILFVVAAVGALLTFANHKAMIP